MAASARAAVTMSPSWMGTRRDERKKRVDSRTAATVSPTIKRIHMPCGPQPRPRPSPAPSGCELDADLLGFLLSLALGLARRNSLAQLDALARQLIDTAVHGDTGRAAGQP